MKDIGALWKKTGQKGEFLSGTVIVNDVACPIVVFKNDYKKQANHPDYKIFLAQKPALNANGTEKVEDEINPDDIPF